MFNAEGAVACTVTDVMIADSKFAKGPNDFDLCVQVASIEDPSQSDWWRGECSNEYGRGAYSTMTQVEITMKTIRNIGYEGIDLTQAKAQLVGKPTPVMIKSREYNGRTIYDVQYIGSNGSTPTAIDNATANARMQALIGGAPSAPAPAMPAAPPPAPEPALAGASAPNPNPFA